MYYVYSLVDPSTQKPFYIGLTENPHKRLLSHISMSIRKTHENAELETIIRGIILLNKTPSVVILEETNSLFPHRIESKWIKKALESGWKICNVTGTVNARNKHTLEGVKAMLKKPSRRNRGL